MSAPQPPAEGDQPTPAPKRATPRKRSVAPGADATRPLPVAESDAPHGDAELTELFAALADDQPTEVLDVQPPKKRAVRTPRARATPPSELGAPIEPTLAPIEPVAPVDDEPARVAPSAASSLTPTVVPPVTPSVVPPAEPTERLEPATSSPFEPETVSAVPEVGLGVPGESEAPPAQHAAPTARNFFEAFADRLDSDGFFGALFDFTFRRYVTRKLAGPVYVVGLTLIALSTLLSVIYWLTQAIATHSFFGAFVFLFGLLITIVGTALSVLLLRVGIEVFVAVIEIAENTRPGRRRRG